MNIETLRNRIQKLMNDSFVNGTTVCLVTINEKGVLRFDDGQHVYESWEQGAEYIEKLKAKAFGEFILIIDDIPLCAANPQLAKKWDEFERNRLHD